MTSEADIVAVRRTVRRFAKAVSFDLVAETKLVTATSELCRNLVEHGGGGRVSASVIESGNRRGVAVEFVDTGPGIADPELALSDGYSSRHGLGLGLGGSRRLVDEFELSTEVGQGTRVRIVSWSRRATR